MEKLQYDSFYKFIVSIGVLLIAAPVVFFHLWISGAYDVTISQKDFKELDVKVAEILSRKIGYINKLGTVLPLVLGIVEIVGIVLFVWGCCKWYEIQKDLDKISKLDVKEKDIRLQKMSVDEKVEKIVKEANEETKYKKYDFIGVNRVDMGDGICSTKCWNELYRTFYL